MGTLKGDEKNTFYMGVEEALKGLLAQEVDRVQISGLAARWLFKEQPELENKVERDARYYLIDRVHYLAATSAKKALIDKLNISLTNIVKNGTYASIFKKWVGDDVPDHYIELMKFLDSLHRPRNFAGDLITEQIRFMAQKDPTKFGAIADRIDNEVMPALRRLDVPQTVSAATTYAALRDVAEHIVRVARGFSQGSGEITLDDVLRASPPIQRAFAEYQSALHSMITVP